MAPKKLWGCMHIISVWLGVERSGNRVSVRQSMMDD